MEKDEKWREREKKEEAAAQQQHGSNIAMAPSTTQEFWSVYIERESDIQTYLEEVSKE